MLFGCDYFMLDFVYLLYYRNEFNYFFMVMIEVIICILVKMIFSVFKLIEEIKYFL